MTQLNCVAAKVKDFSSFCVVKDKRDAFKDATNSLTKLKWRNSPRSSVPKGLILAVRHRPPSRGLCSAISALKTQPKNGLRRGFNPTGDELTLLRSSCEISNFFHLNLPAVARSISCCHIFISVSFSSVFRGAAAPDGDPDRRSSSGGEFQVVHPHFTPVVILTRA